MREWYRNLTPHGKAIIPTIIIFLFIILPLFWYANIQYKNFLLHNERVEVELEVERFGSSLDKALNNRMLLLNGLEGFIEANEYVLVDEEFTLYAEGLTSTIDGVRNVIIAPNGINTFVYPIEGNETSIGHDQVNDARPSVRESVEQAIETKEIIVSGPYELRQGGLGIIFKKAIFYDGEFWGMISEVLDVEPIFEISGLQNYQTTLNIAIRNQNGIIEGDADVFINNPEIYYLQLPQGELEVAAIPVEGWDLSIGSRNNVFFYLMTVLSLLIIVQVYLMYYRKNRLHFLVLKKTRQIEKANLQLTTLLDGLWDWNIETNDFLFSEQYEIMLGYDAGSLPNTLETFHNLLHPDELSHVMKDIQNYFDKKDEQFYENSFRLQAKDSSWKWVLLRGMAKYNKNGTPIRFAGYCTDISEQRKEQIELEYIAKHDSLTNLPNRFSLTELLTHSMLVAKRNNKILALLYIDLDEFKNINDKYGHDVGDEVLSVVASRMKNVVRASDIVSRIGGDEFVVVIEDLNEVNDALPLIQKCLNNIFNEIQCSDITIKISASIGVSFYPQTSDIGNEVLIRQADQAMYEAKNSGKNKYNIFNIEASEEIKESLLLISRVSNAIEENELSLHYQPKVNMENDKVIGVEALLRWNHPDKGLLYPDSFLPIIENQPKLMIKLGKWVFHEAFSQLEVWNKLGYDINMSINVSAYEIQQEDFPSFLKKLFQIFPLVKPKSIEIEILETASFYDTELTIKILQTCQEIGVSIAIDDFGTGYASMHHLKKFPINTIKIDKSFILDLLYETSSMSIVEGSIGFANAFNTSIIAEGVETIEHGRLLLQLGCELAQGYAIARPMPAEDVISWILSYKGTTSWINVHTTTETLK